MLTHLRIRHILLLKECDIAFGAGLNVLTGETGAGKSILLDALGLVLGERSDAALVRPGEDQASVVAEFDIGGMRALQALLRELGLEADGALVLRRNLSRDGKSRAFVNDAPVSVSALKRIGEVLVERHGQHDQRGLLDSRTHRAAVDMFGGHTKLLAKISESFSLWKETRSALEMLRAQAEKAMRDQEWLQQTVEELHTLAPQTGEEEALVVKRKHAQEAAHSLTSLQEALALLTESSGVALQLRQVGKLLARSSALEEVIHTQLEQAENAVQEIATQIERVIEVATLDPALLEAAEERLHALRAAARKYQVAVALLPEVLADATQRLSTLTHLDTQMHAAELALTASEQAYRDEAMALFAAREQAGVQLAKTVMKELKPLKMASTQLRVVQQELPMQSWGEEGMHQVLLEVATNAGMPFGSLAKVASGGELSRLMLALKVSLREAAHGTAIFDEIDTGTGGAVAEAIGARLKRLATDAQVLVVTHAPQVAAMADRHLRIRKTGGKSVTTAVETLDEAARREELARMLSGATISDEARKAAGKLMQEAS